MLQEDEIGFTKLDASHWGQKPNKKKSRHITFQGIHYKQLFTLAQIIYLLYNSKKESYFGNVLRTSLAPSIKLVCTLPIIVTQRPKGDIHSIGQGFDYNKQFTSNEEYKNRKSFYFLEQGHVLKNFLELWSSLSFKEQLKTTTSDRLQAIGLLFQQDLRGHIPYILKTYP